MHDTVAANLGELPTSIVRHGNPPENVQAEPLSTDMCKAFTIRHLEIGSQVLEIGVHLHREEGSRRHACFTREADWVAQHLERIGAFIESEKDGATRRIAEETKVEDIGKGRKPENSAESRDSVLTRDRIYPVGKQQGNKASEQNMEENYVSFAHSLLLTTYLAALVESKCNLICLMESKIPSCQDVQRRRERAAYPSDWILRLGSIDRKEHRVPNKQTRTCIRCDKGPCFGARVKLTDPGGGAECRWCSQVAVYTLMRVVASIWRKWKVTRWSLGMVGHPESDIDGVTQPRRRETDRPQNSWDAQSSTCEQNSGLISQRHLAHPSNGGGAARQKAGLPEKSPAWERRRIQTISAREHTTVDSDE
ncbi:hypothetical protein C8R45DRAFT_921806 [Mycena sanguinolenta]|nr:hypothetical protein C8R45DRAFT_921806 [Mycena sanguinolenta]